MREHSPSHLSKWDCTSALTLATYLPVKFKTWLKSCKEIILSSNIPLKQIVYHRSLALLIIVPTILMINVSLLIELEWYTYSLMWVDMASKTPFNLAIVNAIDLRELPLLPFEEIKVLVGISLNLLQKIWYMMLVLQHWFDVFSTMHLNKQ